MFQGKPAGQNRGAYFFVGIRLSQATARLCQPLAGSAYGEFRGFFFYCHWVGSLDFSFLDTEGHLMGWFFETQGWFFAYDSSVLSKNKRKPREDRNNKNTKCQSNTQHGHIGSVILCFACFLEVSCSVPKTQNNSRKPKNMSDPNSASMDTQGLMFLCFWFSGGLYCSYIFEVGVSKKKQVSARRKHLLSRPGHFTF